MSYIELINRFWRLDETVEFSPSETRLYFYLLKVANSLGWPDEFEITDVKLCGNVGMGKNTMKPARLRLEARSLIAVDLSRPGLRDGASYCLSPINSWRQNLKRICH
ncbi:hypothetical protein [Larkinella arboricola]